MIMMMTTTMTSDANASSSPLSLSKTAATTCSSLLHDLQEIWNEIGENDSERDKMLLQLEQECLDIYRRKVEKTRKYKADLHQSLAEAEAEIARLVSALGERISIPRYEKRQVTLKQQLSAISPVLEDLRLRNQERIKEFQEMELQIAQICAEIAGSDQSVNPAKVYIDESDLTLKRLGELTSRLQELQSEKSLRLRKVNGYVRSIQELSIIMSLDIEKLLSGIHPCLVDVPNDQSKSISNEMLAILTSEVNSLKQEKQQRLQKLQNLASTLIQLWNLMETPVEERRRFDHVTCFISASVDEVFSQGCLANNVIKETEAEVECLNILKVSKMKELILKRQCELEEIYKGVHMDVDSETARQIITDLIESDNIDLSDLLSSMDDQIAKAKEQALSRKDILDKVEKWKHAAEEESWLDEYEQDENRYSAGRGAHKNLKRAEKARILVNKIPSLVENLMTKTKAWEMEKGMPFLYDKAPLLHSLEEYTILRREKEEEKRRYREQKRLQEQVAAEQEALYGSRSNVRKPLVQSTNANIGTPNSRRVGTPARYAISGGKERRDSGKVGNIIPVNYVALPKDDQVTRGG